MPHDTKELAKGISRLYGCESVTWLRSQPAHKEWFGDVAAEGVVHLFEVTGFHRTDRIWAFDYRDGDWHYSTTPYLPRASDAESAVKHIAARLRKNRRTIKVT